ncbi:MAG: hypothetical protein PVG49_11365 [Desulfobacteraceae bacterium]
MERRSHLTGWILFIVCAVFFMTAAWKNHDTLTFIGSIVFLIACVVFLLPLMQPAHSRDREKE